MSNPQQLAFPFASLDFEGFTVLTVDQIAVKLNYTSQHILNLVEQGDLHALDGKSVGVTRRNCRIPLEEYRAWVLKRMTGVSRVDFIATLPRSVREALITELRESLKS